MMLFRSLAVIAALAFGGVSAFAQGTLLAPPGVQWGAAGTQVPAPTIELGYDSSTGLPCIIGKTGTCNLPISVTGTPTVNCGTGCAGSTVARFTASPAVTAGAYSAGQSLGALQSFTVVANGLIQGMQVK